MSGADTIVAPATPEGESALALIRVSGPEAATWARHFRRGRPLLAGRLWHGDYRGVRDDDIDDVVFAFFEAPRSFTGEHVLEISCHGNPLIITRILEDLRVRGGRLAEPGEFARRAFLNGRIDLTRAEAIMEVIRARSDRALEVARQQLRGALGRRIDAAVTRLVEICAGIEAYIDFPDEDLPPEDRDTRKAALDALHDELSRLGAAWRDGDLLRRGARILLVGAPNAGKSSLLNRLLGYERAIVDREPGTTRDFLEAETLVGPHRVVLIDTAGVHDGASGVEQAGIRHTLQLAETADFFLLVLDRTAPPLHLPQTLLARLSLSNALIINNKTDLEGGSRSEPFEGFHHVEASALTGSGINELRERLRTLIDARIGPEGDETRLMINSRHAGALDRALASLDRARALLASCAPLELVGSELRGVIDALGEIVGRIDNERVLDALFASFCIGK